MRQPLQPDVRTRFLLFPEGNSHLNPNTARTFLSARSPFAPNPHLFNSPSTG